MRYSHLRLAFPPTAAAAAVALAILCLSAPLAGQVEHPMLEPGDRIRVDHGPMARVTGVLVQQDGRLLVLRPDAEEETTLEIPFDRVNRLELGACCNRAAGFGAGALIGVGVALGGGLLLQTLPSEHGPNMAMAGAVVVGVPIGVLVGGLIGRAKLAPTRWVEVPLP